MAELSHFEEIERKRQRGECRLIARTERGARGKERDIQAEAMYLEDGVGRDRMN